MYLFISFVCMTLNPEVWGPHYWFFLHTIALTYPSYPNAITKKKYYNFIQDLPLFIPDAKIAKEFSDLLDKYPVTPYLDSRPSFNKWMHFIHNKINIALDYPELTMEEAMTEYYKHYKPKAVVSNENRVRREKVAFGGFMIFLFVCGVFLYTK